MEVREDLMAKQASVLTKEHIDRLLAEDRRIDATGKIGQCSLEKLLSENGALDDGGSKYGDLAQAAASYYVRQRMDDINERSFQLRKSGKGVGFYPGSAMGRLANQIANVDYDLSKRCERYTAVIDNGTEHLLASTGYLDHYEYDVNSTAVHFPSDTRRFVDGELGTPERTMDSVMRDVQAKGLTYEFYSHNQKLYLQDRFCHLLPDSVQLGKDCKTDLFDEVYKACEIAQVMDSRKGGFLPKEQHSVKALFGNSIGRRLEEMGYFDYMVQRDMTKQNNREIKNVPDFMKDGGMSAKLPAPEYPDFGL